MPVKQVVVCRMQYTSKDGSSFKLRTGKIAAQVAHASLKVFTDGFVPGIVSIIDQDGASYDPMSNRVIRTNPSMIEWLSGEYTKVVLGVDTETELLNIYDTAKAQGLPAALIQDAGHTEFHGVPTFTTCAIGPADADAIDRITGKGGMFQTRLL